MRREERETVQGPVKEQQPDGLSHGGQRSAHWQSACVQGCKLTDFSVSAVSSNFARFAVGEWWCVVFNNSVGRGLLLPVL